MKRRGVKVEKGKTKGLIMKTTRERGGGEGAKKEEQRQSNVLEMSGNDRVNERNTAEVKEEKG